MPERSRGHLAAACALLGLAASACGANTGFVKAQGTGFVVDGKPFRFGGANCNYLTFKDQYMLDSVIGVMANHSMSVLRVLAFIDVGKADGSGSIDGMGMKDGTAFQYYDAGRKGPVVNVTALTHLDAVLATASRYGIRVMLTLTNNWRDFGGMDQYVRWRQWGDPTFSAHHDNFYNDSVIMGWYKSWAGSLINRTNTVTGVPYKDDPTIFGWELANEPRCSGSGDYPQTGDCVKDYAVMGKTPAAWKILAWVKEMSAYVKSLDSNHLVSVGDEGFWCQPYADCQQQWCDCLEGVDSMAFSSAPHVDFMSVHLYPNLMGGDANGWASAWLTNHTKAAAQINKPVILGEYGFQHDMHQTYQRWTDVMLNAGMSGWLVWMLAGRDNGAASAGGWYPNYDGLSVYCADDPQTNAPGSDKLACGVLAAAAAAISNHTSVPAAAMRRL
eukprot:TRINITY_DN30771_c0_g1_i1.p1 TRINITY_DN30771_c0_g1~~TRINITY_DN30771_c0_g1_i1.p1  ORF type:complete len:476 (+),score=140.33 TRINITY_DN30771_c0_g1_i1:100-1428(+)